MQFYYYVNVKSLTWDSWVIIEFAISEVSHPPTKSPLPMSLLSWIHKSSLNCDEGSESNISLFKMRYISLTLLKHVCRRLGRKRDASSSKLIWNMYIFHCRGLAAKLTVGCVPLRSQLGFSPSKSSRYCKVLKPCFMKVLCWSMKYFKQWDVKLWFGMEEKIGPLIWTSRFGSLRLSAIEYHFPGLHRKP